MALLELLQIPDPRLKKPSRKITHVDEKLKKLVADMEETMIANDGVGLAAIQVGVPKRLFICRMPALAQEEISAEEAIEILDSDDEEAKKWIQVIVPDEASNDDEDAELTYIRKKIVWGELMVFINPKIVEKEGVVIDDEGCLSDLGYQAKVERARRVVIAAQDIEMKPFKYEADGLEARCIQHENDHLDGILYTERMIDGTRGKMGEDESDGENGEMEIEAAGGIMKETVKAKGKG